MQFELPSAGDYAVLYSPNSTPDPPITFCEEDDFCKYIRSGNLLANLISAVVGLLIFLYILYKVFNLFTKLKQSKERARKL